MTARLVLALTLAAALAGCGGGSSSGSAEDALSETADKLGEIRSGEILFRIEFGSDDEETGFTVEGPFAFAESEDELPLAELEYTQAAGSESESVTFISTGDRVFVGSDGETVELPEDRVESLRGTGASDGSEGSGDLGALEIGDWFQDPKVRDGGEVGGAETDRISSQLDVVAAANDLLGLAGSFGGGETQTIEGRSAEQLERAIQEATIDVWTGKDDRLLRRLVIEATFQAEPPPELEDLFASLPTAEFSLELAVTDPNQEVTVEEPTDAQPPPAP